MDGNIERQWRSLGILCRELGWSKSRAVYELRNGLRHRTIPPGQVIDWHNSNVTHSLNVETGEVMLVRGVLEVEGALAPDTLTVSIEVLPPTDAGVPSAPADAPTPPASASVQWAIGATRKLRAKNKIPDGVTKADLARLLEAEAQEAVRAGEIRRALKATYLEDQLRPWGIWPLSSFE